MKAQLGSKVNSFDRMDKVLNDAMKSNPGFFVDCLDQLLRTMPRIVQQHDPKLHKSLKNDLDLIAPMSERDAQIGAKEFIAKLLEMGSSSDPESKNKANNWFSQLLKTAFDEQTSTVSNQLSNFTALAKKEISRVSKERDALEALHQNPALAA
jgi:hypothetical protein